MLRQARLYYVFTDFFNSILLVFLPLFIKLFYKYSDDTFGTILLVAGFFAIGGIVLGHFMVKLLKNEKYVLMIEFILMALAIMLLYFNVNVIVVGGAVGLCYLNRMAMYTIGDNLMVEIAKQKQLAFGKLRSFGSIGWGLSFFLNGFLIVNFPRIFLLVWLVLVMIAIINMAFLPKLNREAVTSGNIKYRELFKYKNVLKYLVLSTIIYVLLYSVPPFINLRILELKGRIEIYSLITAFFVILEFVMIYFANEYRKRVHDKYYLMTIGGFLTLKMFLIYSAASAVLIYLTALFDPIIFGLILSFNAAYLKQSSAVALNGLTLNIFGVLSLLFIALSAKFSTYLMAMFDLQNLFIFYLILAVLSFILPAFFKINDYSHEEF